MAKHVDTRRPLIVDFCKEQRALRKVDEKNHPVLFARFCAYKENPSGSLQEALSEGDERVCVDAATEAILEDSDLGATVRSLEHDGINITPESAEDDTAEWQSDVLALVNKASPHRFEIKPRPSPAEILATLQAEHPDMDFQTIEETSERVEENRLLLATYLKKSSSTNVDLIVSDLLADYHLFLEGVEFTVRTVWRCIPDERTQSFAQWEQKVGRWHIKTEGEVYGALRRCAQDIVESVWKQDLAMDTPPPAWVYQDRGISKGIKDCFRLLYDRDFAQKLDCGVRRTTCCSKMASSCAGTPRRSKSARPTT